MNVRLLSSTFTACLVLAACSSTEDPARPPSVRVTHPASSPLAATSGDFAFATGDVGVAATLECLEVLTARGTGAGQPREGFPGWSLTSTGAGPAVTGLAMAPEGAPLGRVAFFLPSGRPQAGAVEVTKSDGTQGELFGEGVLAEELASAFPSAIAAPEAGPASDGLWIVDAVFGPGSSVKVYPYASWDEATKKISEAKARRFAPAADDVDGDSMPDATSLAKLHFADEGRVGLVTFSFLAPAPRGAAGGVYAFDPATGAARGRVIVPIASTSTSALAYVQSVRATEDRLIIVSAEKNEKFEDIGGYVWIYRVRSWSPLEVEDSDASKPYDQPEVMLATSKPNAVGLEIHGGGALVLAAPFFAIGALDVVDLSVSPPKIVSSVELGELYVMGYFVPGDPRVSPMGDEAVIGTEAGLVRVELSEQK
jgi:hypothetical protein